MSAAGRLAIVLAVLLLAAPTGAGAIGDGPTGQTDIADATVLAADLEQDGDAAFRVTYRIELDDQNATEAFESLRQDIEANTSDYVTRFRDRIRRTVAEAENATGREMRVENVRVEVRTETQPDTTFGIVTYRFDWRGFAAVDGDRVTAGDALDGLILDDGTSLRLAWPDRYAVASATPEPTEREATAAVWRGPEDFDAGEPRLTVAPAGQVTATPTSTDGPDADTGGLPLWLLLAAALLVGGGAVLAVRRRGGEGAPTDATDRGDGASGPTPAGQAAGPDEPPEELLSNEERVLRLLRDNGGRMKQKEVADRLDWTAAKTSQVVGDLRDAGDLDSFRLGRENVLTLPEVDIDAGGDDTDGQDGDTAGET